MLTDKDKPPFKGAGLLKPGTRKFPVILLITAAILSSVVSAYGGISAIILSLGYLMFTMSFFLVLITVFHRIKILKQQRDDEKTAEKPETEAGSSLPLASHFLSPVYKILNKAWNAVWRHITSFYLEERKTEDSAVIQNKTAERETSLHSGALIEIQKDTTTKHGQEGAPPTRARYEVLYVLSFIVIAIWRISRMFAIVPLSYTEFYYSIVDAVLLLVFPCVAVTYLKIRKDEGSYPADKTSRDLLTLLSYVSLIYAAVIAVTLVLNVNILAVLQWVFYAAMIYLIAALAMNILLSILKNKIAGDFNYTLMQWGTFGARSPKLSKTDDGSASFLDSQEIRLNFSLKSLYTIKYTLKVLPGLVLALGFILLLSTTFFVVHPHQEAAVYRFGKLRSFAIVGEGIHFKLPWPVDRLEIYDIHRINSMQIGRTQFRDGGEYLLLLGNGNEKVSVNMRINYNISDLYAYIKTSTKAEAILSAAAYEALFNRTVNTTLDAFLSIDRSSLSASILDELSELSISEGLGLSVVQIIIEGIHPPADVADVYQMVVSASIDRNTMITVAETEAEKKLIDADQQSRSIVNYAHARQHSRTSAALQEMAVFYAAMEAHAINRESFELTKYLDTYERVIGGSKVYVFSPRMENSIPRTVIGQLNTAGILGGAYE